MNNEKKLKLQSNIKKLQELYGKEEVVRRMNGFIMTSDPVYLPIESDIRYEMGSINTQELLDLILEDFFAKQ